MDDGLSEEQRAALTRFAEAARAFCAFVEAGAGEDVDTLCRARAVMAEVYALAAALPEVTLSDDAPEVDAPFVRAAGWQGFGRADLYWMLYEPYQSEEPVCGSLNDDFLDTYRDLRQGLLLYDAGHAAAAGWDWHHSFEWHWGRHGGRSALRALHSACDGGHGEGIAARG